MAVIEVKGREIHTLELFFHLFDWEMWSFLSPLFHWHAYLTAASPALPSATQDANHRGIAHIAGHAWLYPYANGEIYLSSPRQASFPSSRRGRAGGGGEDEAAGSLQRGLCREFWGVKYVMKSFAGPLSTWPCLGCFSDRHAYSTYATPTPVSFL